MFHSTLAVAAKRIYTNMYLCYEQYANTRISLILKAKYMNKDLRRFLVTFRSYLSVKQIAQESENAKLQHQEKKESI